MKCKALERDPLSPLVHVQIALSYWNRRQYEAAIDWANRALAIDPRHLLAREFLAGAHVMQGDYDRYMAENLRHAVAFGAPAEALVPLQDAFASGGLAAVIRYTIEQLISGAAHGPAFPLAVLFALLGDRDSAFVQLDRAIASRDPGLVDLAVAPQWDALRGDPRFVDCLTRVGLPVLRSAG